MGMAAAPQKIFQPQHVGASEHPDHDGTCLLYTSDAADERSSVDLGGRRIIKKKKSEQPGAGRKAVINK